ncbi:Fructose-bisphosphate aldolase class 1 [Methanoculleus chikugoensis]|jgi:fructose-bisphosphate aldolase/6-deoxy-5-ketofructose 1-phosphate synthase|uniref:fructose-bisphosphate aldolase n=1 Tax=Methanoculleus chikugoensis TaxID=118126 RepID=A0A1M4MM80_9EURY|nr:aldolase [Methanoculleus chikugoensis]MDD4566323.1 aldolase [Methanoculleus chikugoensis]SCL76044.1 Fructose-bisphosphate aldolase class 1 [Methanoculleus chikugoensis]
MPPAPDIRIPLDVPSEEQERYRDNYRRITHGTGRLMLFAGDQKVEHLNDDFYGEGIHPDDADPEHLFRIAIRARIGVFATQLGMIARYGEDYRDVPYLVKLNSKTHLVKTAQRDPLSSELHLVRQVVDLRDRTGLAILGVGYTIYLGSEYEPMMLYQAAQIVNNAHANGLITVLWMYPRGKAVKDERDPHLVAGAAGVAATLGSDFVKVNPPKAGGTIDAALLREAVAAGGRTGVVCAGGSHADMQEFLQQLHDQIHIGGTVGNATGRNIHQRPLDEAVRFCNAISAITLDDASVEEANKICMGGRC